MRIGAFELKEPMPELNEPYVFAILRPWIDVSNVGSLILSDLEARFGAKELASLAKPGHFFDFTRYRPVIQTLGEMRKVTIPNTIITYAKRQAGNDFLFVRLLEPHNQGEAYTSSIWQVLKKLDIRRYCLIGSMSDMVPHTRPLLISGNIGSGSASQALGKMGVYQSRYQGPTTICNLITQAAQKAGIEVLTLIVHLPQYTDFEEDYQGVIALSGVLGELYDIPVDAEDNQKAASQSRSVDAALQDNPKLKAVVTELEKHSEQRAAARGGKTESPQLSPEVERFLKEQEDRFRGSSS